MRAGGIVGAGSEYVETAKSGSDFGMIEYSLLGANMSAGSE